MMDPFLKHNDKVRRGNTPPALIPQPVDDLESLIAEYNRVEAEQETRLAQLWATMAGRKGSQRHITFSNKKRWTTNDFPNAERLDLVMGRAMDGFTALITHYDLGE